MECQEKDIAKIKENLKSLDKKIDEIVEVLAKMGTGLRDSRDRGAFHAGNYLGGALEGLRKNKIDID